MQVQIPTGKLAGAYSRVGEGFSFFTTMGAFAEVELDILLERTMAGLAAARGHGRTGVDPRLWTPTSWPPPAPNRTNGESATSIAKALGVSRAGIYRHLARTDSV